ncbi:unnamed protein product [Cylindrotheca closterium]|uniref:Uncharacterized protein n=1 Tax=Cylindrotheca closterium TaxID=2856 RepID=A0AAD2G5Y1_9STRA|nr:unnamed protein product [Cylindrotheca closterium]
MEDELHPEVRSDRTVIQSPKGYSCFCGQRGKKGYFKRHLQSKQHRLTSVALEDIIFEQKDDPICKKGYVCHPCQRFFGDKSNFVKHFLRKEDDTAACNGNRVDTLQECMVYETLHYCRPVPPLQSGDLLGDKEISTTIHVPTPSSNITNSATGSANMIARDTIKMTINAGKQLAKQLVQDYGAHERMVRIIQPFVLSSIEATPLLDFLKTGNEKMKETPSHFIAGAEEWLMEHSAMMIGQLMGNVRHEIVAFRVETEYESIFTCRDKTGPILTELKKIIQYTWRSFGLPSGFVDEHDPTEVPRYLHLLAVQSGQSVIHKVPAILKFLSFRIFSGTKQLKGSFVIGSTMATLLYLCRLGSLCVAYRMCGENFIQRQLDLCRQVQCGQVVQTISPLIRQLREFEKFRKTLRDGDYITNEGDIFVGGNKFEKKVWSRLVPKIEDRLCDLFGQLLIGNGQLLLSVLLDPATSPKTTSLDGGFGFQVTDQVGSANFCFEANETVMEKIHKLIQLVFHGLGFGAMRFQEILEMEDCSTPRFFNNQIW